MNATHLHSNHRHVFATHVAIKLRVKSWRMDWCRQRSFWQYNLNFTYFFLLNLNVQNHYNIKIILVIIKWLKWFCFYTSSEVLYGGCIYSLCVDAVVVLVWYVIFDYCLILKILVYFTSFGKLPNFIFLALQPPLWVCILQPSSGL